MMSSHVMAAPRPEMATAQEHPTVVVIDDDASIRKALENLLRSVGLDVELFKSPQEFLQSNRPDRPGCPGPCSCPKRRVLLHFPLKKKK